MVVCLGNIIIHFLEYRNQTCEVEEIRYDRGQRGDTVTAKRVRSEMLTSRGLEVYECRSSFEQNTWVLSQD